MAHIILTGATGCAGAAVLDRALKSPAITHVSVLSRRPVKLAENQPKAHVIIHKDFESYPQDVLDQLKGATGCVCFRNMLFRVPADLREGAQGISSRGMSESDYSKITIDYPVAAAKAFAGLSPTMNFVYMSGEGADMEEKASFMFGRIKGRAEKTLLKLGKETGSLHVFNIRPAVINPQGNYLQERKPTLHDKTSTLLGNIFGTVWKAGVIPTAQLAQVCLDLATGDGTPLPEGQGVEADGRLLRNTALRRLAGM